MAWVHLMQCAGQRLWCASARGDDLRWSTSRCPASTPVLLLRVGLLEPGLDCQSRAQTSRNRRTSSAAIVRAVRRRIQTRIVGGGRHAPLADHWVSIPPPHRAWVSDVRPFPPTTPGLWTSISQFPNGFDVSAGLSKRSVGCQTLSRLGR